MGGGGHIADMNNRMNHFSGLLRRKRLSENKLLQMPIGKNSKIITKSYLSEEEKLVLSRKYLEYYRKERIKTLKIVALSLIITSIIVSGLVFAFLKLI